MKDRLPQVVAWKQEVELYPKGNWLVDPRQYGDYVQLVGKQLQAADLEAMSRSDSYQRLRQWQEVGGLEPLQLFDFMQHRCQVLPHPIHTQPFNLGGLEGATAYTQGYRQQYQDRTQLFCLPMGEPVPGSSKTSTLSPWAFVTALFDGHGPQQGGGAVAQLLSSAEGRDLLIQSVGDWSQRIGCSWAEMEEADIENGWHFAMLQLQQFIRKRLVENLHQSHVATQAKSLLITLQHTLKSMALMSQPAAKRLKQPLYELEQLQSLLQECYSLEGVGSTAVYTLWWPDPERDRIDLWVISVGDSWAGLLSREGPHYALVDEALPNKPLFLDQIVRRGGWVERDSQGVARLNGEYSLCRGLGDLYVLREWAEVKACVQIRGMSPRPTLSKVTLCEQPQAAGELAFSQVAGFVHHCDGLKEAGTLNSAQICSFLAQALEKGSDLQLTLYQLIQRAVEGGSSDNCTLELLDLRPLSSPSLRKRFYRQLQPSLLFQSSNFFHGFL